MPVRLASKLAPPPAPADAEADDRRTARFLVIAICVVLVLGIVRSSAGP